MLNFSYIDKFFQNNLESLNKLNLNSINFDYTNVNESYKDENSIFEKKLEDNMEFFDKYSKSEYNNNNSFYDKKNNEIFFDLNDKKERDNFSRPLTIFEGKSLPNKSKKFLLYTFVIL